MNEEKIDELISLLQSVVPDTSDMSDAGRIGFVYRFDYDSTTNYEELDVVKFGMSLWTPKKETTGNPPPDQSQEGQENVQENDFWQLFLPGALGSDYVKKTDLAKSPTETEPGKAGIVIPDGKTITIDAAGMLVGASSGFTGTKKQVEEADENGEIEEGMTVIILDDETPAKMIDSELSETSTNPVQNKVITAALEETNSRFGGITLSVTEAGLVRASWDDTEQEGQ